MLFFYGYEARCGVHCLVLVKGPWPMDTANVHVHVHDMYMQ